MNQYPFIPPLDPKQVKELIRQIRVLRYDYPNLGDDDLADEWFERQRMFVEDGRADPFEDWRAGSEWRSGFRKALAFALRLEDRKQQHKASRVRAKEYRQDREPATPRQQRFVKRMAEKRGEALPAPPEELSKLAASRLIQRFLDPPS